MIPKLHYISEGYSSKELLENIQNACTSGAELVQLCLNNESKTNILKLASAAREITSHFQTRLIIKDNYKIAKETALEWDIDEKEINTENMIFYGLISTAIDKINNDKVSYIENVLGFINTDLICYRADGPNELVDLQNSSWNPINSFIKK